MSTGQPTSETLTCWHCEALLRIPEGDWDPSWTCPRCLALLRPQKPTALGHDPSQPAREASQLDREVRRDGWMVAAMLATVACLLGFVGVWTNFHYGGDGRPPSPWWFSRRCW